MELEGLFINTTVTLLKFIYIYIMYIKYLNYLLNLLIIELLRALSPTHEVTSLHAFS